MQGGRGARRLPRLGWCSRCARSACWRARVAVSARSVLSTHGRRGGSAASSGARKPDAGRSSATRLCGVCGGQAGWATPGGADAPQSEHTHTLRGRGGQRTRSQCRSLTAARGCQHSGGDHAGWRGGTGGAWQAHMTRGRCAVDVRWRVRLEGSGTPQVLHLRSGWSALIVRWRSTLV